jgi:hypothetical protein
LRSHCKGWNYLKASELTRKTTQDTPVAQEGKPRAKSGRNTHTNSTSDNQHRKPLKLLKGSYMGIHRTRPNGTYFKSNYGRWAPFGISKGNEATALCSKSILTRLHHFHLNGVDFSR